VYSLKAELEHYDWGFSEENSNFAMLYAQEPTNASEKLLRSDSDMLHKEPVPLWGLHVDPVQLLQVLRFPLPLRVVRDCAQTHPHDPPSSLLTVRMLSACQYRQTFLLVSCAGNGIMFVCSAEIQWKWSLCSLKVLKLQLGLQREYLYVIINSKQ
jgi:hypothetical protein